MASSATSLELQTRIEDVLAYLPISSTTEFKKGQTIYTPEQPAKRIYLVVSGKVEISQITGKGKEVLLEIIRPDELFGESAFLDLPRRCEQATAFEKASVMAWPVSDMEDLVMKRPRLAVALMQLLVRRNAESTRRIESFSTESIERRLAGALIRFSERLGTTEKDGTLKMMPFTHVMLSRYVGTSREVVTHHMNRFRERGYVTYSRQGILLYPQAMSALIN